MMASFKAKRVLALSSLVGAMAVSVSALAADNPQAAAAVDRSAVATQILDDWAGFPVPVDAQNNTPWGPVDLTGWVRVATVEQLLAARMATTFDGVVTALRPATVKAPGAVALGAGQPISANALGSLTSDLVYTPVTPCRIIDTRGGTLPAKLGPNTGRDFGISSSNYSAQGGQAASCGIPAGVSAVAINVVSTGQTGLGHLKVVESGASLPGAAFLNYQPGVNTANAGISKVALVSSTQGLFLYSGGSASDAVVDIMGYFTSPSSSQAASTDGSGAVTFPAAAPVCQTAPFTPTQNWTARPFGAVSLLADASGSLGFGTHVKYSTDGGTTWNNASGSWIMRGGAGASSWGYSAPNVTSTISLVNGLTYIFGIEVIRYTGTGNATDSRCSLRVAVG